jgi:ABC-type phosphate transport system auxiliary subunit
MSNTKLLYELPKLRHRLRELQGQIDDLRLQAECIGSVRPKERVQTSPDLSARFEDTIAERAELEKQYQDLYAEYNEKAKTVQAMITRLYDPELDAEKMYRIRMILTLRYIFDQDWRHIAIQLGTSLRHTYRLKNVGLDMLDALDDVTSFC